MATFLWVFVIACGLNLCCCLVSLALTGELPSLTRGARFFDLMVQIIWLFWAVWLLAERA